ELPAQEREDHGVARSRRAVPAVEDAAHRPFLDEAELARDAEARLVGRVDPELDPLHVAELEPDARERGRRLGGKALAHTAGADPVADLEDALAAARVQAAAADRLGLVRREDSVDEVLAEVEAAPEATQQLDLRFHRLGILMRPGHPRPHVLERRVDRL